jgi:hypothetical protein
MEEQAEVVAREGAGVAVSQAPLVVEQNFFLSLIDTMTPATYALAYTMIALFVLQGIFVGVFVLNVLFDTSLTTVAERRRTLVRNLVGIFVIESVIVVLFILLHYFPGGGEA